MDRIIQDKFIIDEDNVKNELERLLDCEVNIDYVCKSAAVNNKYYFDKVLKEVEEEKADLVWLDTGLMATGKTIYISLLHKDDYFSGFFVGTADYLVKGMCNRDPYSVRKLTDNLLKFKNRNKPAIPLQVPDHPPLIKPREEAVGRACNDCVSVAADSIFDNLLFPTWKSKEGLKRFLKVLGKRATDLVAREQAEYFVMNEQNEIIVNTGMMDSFGNDVLALYKCSAQNDYVFNALVQSKSDIIKSGFTKQQALVAIEPISFFDADEDTFTPVMDDFDVNSFSLVHIVQGRRNRFPESMQSLSDEQIAGRLMIELERGVKIQQRDGSYAKAHYSATERKISWLMPLHVNTKLTEDPELVMCISKQEEFYKVKTILTYNDEMKDKITAVSLYRDVW